MFTNQNHEDDSSLTVNLTNNNQIHETSVFEMRHQPHDDSIPLYNTIYDEEQFTLPEILQLETSDKEKISFPTRFNYKSQSQPTLFFQNRMDNEEVDEVSDIGNDIYSENSPWFIDSKILTLTTWQRSSSLFDNIELISFQSMQSLSSYINTMGSVQREILLTPCMFHYEHPVFFLPSGVRNEKVIRNVTFPRYKSICRSSSDRYDDLVDRYHNNVHFMQIAQLIRDLILFCLPTSVHSQSTMMGAFAARSSQVDYGERKRIEEFCRNYQSSSALDDYTKDSPYHRVLNSALRQQRYDIIYQYRHAIIDVIKCLRKPSPFRDKTGSWIFHRGQQMTIFELEKMKNNVGELVSCSSFLSTSLNPQIAEIFAGDGSDDNPCLVSVIFQIRLDTNQPMRPYARIETSFEEEEVLFSPGTRFCLMSCRKLHDNGRLWLFELVAISEKQQEQLILNHGETFLLLSSARGWPVSVVVVHHIIT